MSEVFESGKPLIVKARAALLRLPVIRRRIGWNDRWHVCTFDDWKFCAFRAPIGDS